MKRIAIVTSEKWFRRCREDLFLEKHLFKAGYLPEVVCWTDKILWESYDLVILRSVWDYYLDYPAFCTWLSNLKKTGVPLANGVERILQNINKTHQLKQLEFCPTPSILSFICGSSNELFEAIESIKSTCVVIKPSVSASAYNTYLVEKKSENWRHQVNEWGKQMLQGTTSIIVQPYIESIINGEISLVYFHGILSHGVIRFPGVLSQRKPAMPLKEIPRDYKISGQRVVDYIDGKDLLYCRVDLIRHGGQIYVMEIEMAEPDLYLSLEYPNQEQPISRFLDTLRFYFK